MAVDKKRSWWTLHRISERVRDEDFLEAAITAGFLVAAASGEVSADEYDALLDRFQLLADVDRDAIEERLTVAASRLEAEGFAPLCARVGELIGDRASGEAALLVGLATALADHQISEDERATIDDLAAALGVPGDAIPGLLREVH